MPKCLIMSVTRKLQSVAVTVCKQILKMHLSLFILTDGHVTTCYVSGVTSGNNPTGNPCGVQF